ncbi:uncharacterized protein F5147DRAFT_777536 [Suillus discolor]|uniref:Uncharacterized protein n=1 Tax=Suillus discolor TaxID=1912936 RepID=A0A9P7F0M5_9AGAM|nr:uncharacterized protein F5147DRAFT_777536 [Suillus discolor]KAG2098691.1 hypothetical protein F5147DRAFT_777536 [Suillus discolor]
MVELASVAHALLNIHALSLETVLCFVNLASAIKDDSILAQPATYDVSAPPDFLPPSVNLFLGSACTLTEDSVQLCWSVLKHDIWQGSFMSQNSTKTLFNIVTPGSKTCQHQDHKAVEALHALRGQSHFQLRKRLERSRAIVDNPARAISRGAEHVELDGNMSDEGLQEFEVDSNQDHSLAPLKPKKKLRTQFGRNRTHCEVLIVAPCGIIHDRQTFYRAEGVGSVAAFIKEAFPDRLTRPSHIFYDNNCNLAQHVKDDPFFNDISLSVDVFHFNCKHSEKDIFCQENCNPIAFPELTVDDGKWYFNSSVCEQTNSWFGKFNAITRGMKPIKFDFYLDEVILCRNRLTLEKLKREHQRPSQWESIGSSEGSLRLANEDDTLDKIVAVAKSAGDV